MKRNRKKDSMKAANGYMTFNPNDGRLIVWLKIYANKIRMKKGIKLADKFEEKSRMPHAEKGKKFTAIVGSGGIFVFHRYDIKKLKRDGFFGKNVGAMEISRACYYCTNLSDSQKAESIKSQKDLLRRLGNEHLKGRKRIRKR